MKRIRVVACLAACLAPLMPLSLIVQDTQALRVNAVSSELQNEILKLDPRAILINRDDVDPISCDEPIRETPGLVAADFNGDGRVDYAVLLRVGDFKGVTEWQGKSLKLFEIWLAVFLAGDRGNSFRDIVLEKFDQYMPVLVTLDIQPPGIIREYAAVKPERRREVLIEHPGVMRVFCGKSASIFFWNKGDKKFEQIWISD